MTARPQVELPGSDIDVMRDVYMTGTQRKAFDSILARLAESEARAEELRALVNETDTALGALLLECDNERWPKTASQGTCLAYARKARAAIAQEAEREAASA